MGAATEVAEETLGSGDSESGTPSRGASPDSSAPVRRLVEGLGDVIERVLDENGAVVNEETTGSVGNLRVQEEYTDDEGRTVRRVRDGSGCVIGEVLDDEENIAEPKVD